MDGSPVSISIADVQGSSSGMDIAEMRSKAQIPDNIMIRGNSTINSNPPLIVVDGVVMEAFDLKSIDPNDIENVQILKGAEAVALYGARAANGVMIITTKKGRSQNPITTRKNFNETAFFYPQLRTNEKGEILIDFTIPEALTQWHFKAFAHTQDLQSGFVEQMIVTQKQLSISANMPRFLREGDSITMSARLVNLSTAAHYVKVRIQLFNALTMQPVSLLVNPKEAEQGFNLAASTNKAVSFKLFIPAGLDALTYKLTADAGMYTDGEENTLPVLPNRMLVIESMPMMVRSGQERTFTLDKLFKQSSPTLKSKTLTLEYTQNPAWYAIQALPYMMEFPYECSEQIFSRYYANSMATNLVNKLPVIKQVFDAWKQANSPELLSNLEKNQELKAILLEETPWLRDAANETEQKKRIALLFDLNKMSYELGQSLDKLQKKQLPDGAFPWFGGDYPDRYITQHILEGIGQLYHLNIVDAKNKPLKEISDNALAYLGQTLKEEARSEKENKTYEDRNLWPMEIHSYFTLSYFPGAIAKADLQSLLDNYLKLAAKQWTSMNVYQQALVALTMQRNNKPEVAQQIIRSLNETAQHSEELGMYWAANQLGYYWYQSPIETQSLMIELFTEASSDTKAVEEMKIWLLRNKQTSNWKTTKATAAACYALLLKGDNWLEDKGTTEIKLGGKLLKELKPDVKADEGTGYVKTSWTDEQINPSWGKVTLKNNGRTMSYGALHWQYLENLDKITSSQTDIKLERKYFIQKESATGPVLTAIDPQHQPRTGDLLKVVVYLNAGRDFEYVQLKDLRPAGTEPVDVLSSFKFQDGLYYYQVTKDVATNFFISRLNKGSFVFEYRLRVVQPGNYSTGITTVQSMYAPEFNAHSEGARMIIR
jgi:TonB-dependent SusC/RagA subfamily outer membrane receptor